MDFRVVINFLVLEKFELYSVPYVIRIFKYRIQNVSGFFLNAR